MSPPADPTPLRVERGGVTIAGEMAGEGPPVLLLHGLTATRRYVVHGSRAIERSGRLVIAYDARGHGESTRAPGPPDYAYAELVADALAVLDAAGVERAALVGQSMGAATAIGLALAHPERVSALVVITPAHLGAPSADLRRWDALADGLEAGGPDGFLAAMGPPTVPDRWADTVLTVVRQRLERHRDPAAVADALRGVPRSAAFDGLDALTRIAAPTLVVASRDEVDPDHPMAVAREYVARIPDVRMTVEDAGESPLAWRGGRLSEAIVDLLEEVGA